MIETNYKTNQKTPLPNTLNKKTPIIHFCTIIVKYFLKYYTNTQNMKTPTKRQTYTATDHDNARRYYFMGLTLQEISKLMDVPERTLEKWQQKFKWAKEKEPFLIKDKAKELKAKGMTIQRISNILKISTTTVWRYCKD